MACMFLHRLSAAFSADDSIIRATVCESLVCDGDVRVVREGILSIYKEKHDKSMLVTVNLR